MAERLRYVSPRERVLLLKSSPWLKEVHARQLAPIARHMQERHFGPGERLVWANEPVGEVLVVVRGRVAHYRDGELVRRTEGAQMVGLAAALASRGGAEGPAAPGEVVAESRTLALGLDVVALEHALEEDFDLWHQAVRWTASRLIRGTTQPPYLVGRPLRPPRKTRGEVIDLGEKLLRLRRVPPFAGGNMEALAELARVESRVAIPAGSGLWKADDPADYAVSLVEGEVECRAPEYAEASCAGPGVWIGLLDALAGRPRSFSASARTDIVALRLDATPLLAVLEDHFETAMGVLGALAARANAGGSDLD